jgi:hypothetical protein
VIYAVPSVRHWSFEPSLPGLPSDWGADAWSYRPFLALLWRATGLLIAPEGKGSRKPSQAFLPETPEAANHRSSHYDLILLHAITQLSGLPLSPISIGRLKRFDLTPFKRSNESANCAKTVRTVSHGQERFRLVAGVHQLNSQKHKSAVQFDSIEKMPPKKLKQTGILSRKPFSPDP